MSNDAMGKTWAMREVFDDCWSRQLVAEGEDVSPPDEHLLQALLEMVAEQPDYDVSHIEDRIRLRVLDHGFATDAGDSMAGFNFGTSLKKYMRMLIAALESARRLTQRHRSATEAPVPPMMFG